MRGEGGGDMKRPARSPLLALPLAACAILFGLWTVGWRVEALPAWLWGWAALVGVVGVIGARLAQQATPNRVWPVRCVLAGTGYGLTYITLRGGEYLLRGEPLTRSTIAGWTIAALIYGVIMATFFEPA